MKKAIRFIFDSVLPALYETISVTAVLAVICVLYLPVLVLCALVIKGTLPAAWMPWIIVYLVGVAAVEWFQLFRTTQLLRDGSLTAGDTRMALYSVIFESAIAVLWPVLLVLVAILIGSWILYFPIHKLKEWSHK